MTNRFNDDVFSPDECEVLEEALSNFTNYIMESDYYSQGERLRLHSAKNRLIKELMARNC